MKKMQVQFSCSEAIGPMGTIGASAVWQEGELTEAAALALCKEAILNKIIDLHNMVAKLTVEVEDVSS